MVLAHTCQNCVALEIVEHIDVEAGVSDCGGEDTCIQSSLTNSWCASVPSPNLPVSNPRMKAPMDENKAQNTVTRAAMNEGMCFLISGESLLQFAGFS